MAQAYPLLFIAVFLLICVLASKLSARLGVPALILFIGVGMLAGTDGPGHINFDDFTQTKEIGMILLAYILFAGALDTSWDSLKPVALRGIALATIGVALTAGMVGLFAHYVLGVTIIQGLLLGSIVSSTDAAAIFGVLRARGFSLKHRIAPTLEIESGTNDPMAVFLTLGMAELATNPESTIWQILPGLLIQMPIGLGLGYLIGKGAVWLINRLRLEYDGLYPVVTISCVALTYGLAHLVHGNEFLAVYVAGMVLGSSTFVHRISLIQFHDGLAWLLQVTVFLALGLLVFPKQLVPIMGSGILLALFLMLIARPLAVMIALAFTGASRRTKMFLAWAGLRGAFPIILATIPVLIGLEGGHTMFHLVFFVVVTSVLVQGISLRPIAKVLGLLVDNEVNDDLTPAGQSQLFEMIVSSDSPIAGRQVVELGLTNTALLVLLRRDGSDYIPRGMTTIHPGDNLLIATRRDDRDELLTKLGGVLVPQ